MKKVSISKDVVFSNDLPFVLIAGPCQIESREHSLKTVDAICKICKTLEIPFVFKSSFDKANRTSVTGKRGIGLDESLKIFAEIRNEFGIPILTDVHENSQPKLVKEVVDIIQVPAFLCRQTDLLEACAQTGRVVNVKKGQFLSPQDMKNIWKKLNHFETKGILLTERGSSFGYNNLVVDMRSFEIMKQETSNTPVIIDATHSTQSPGGLGNASGGNRDFAPLLARAALASTKIAGIFMEVHENPDCAPSDGPCMIKLEDLQSILKNLKQIDMLVKSQ